VNCICFLCAPIPLHLVAFRAAASRAREPPLFRRFNAAYCRATVVSCIPSAVSFLLSVVRCSPISLGAPFIRPSRIHDVTITSYHPPRQRIANVKGIPSLLRPHSRSRCLLIRAERRKAIERSLSVSLNVGKIIFQANRESERGRNVEAICKGILNKDRVNGQLILIALTDNRSRG